MHHDQDIRDVSRELIKMLQQHTRVMREVRMELESTQPPNAPKGAPRTPARPTVRVVSEELAA